MLIVINKMKTADMLDKLTNKLLVNKTNSDVEMTDTGGGRVLVSGFVGYVPLASQNPHPIIVYSVANYRPHLSHFWANVIVISRTELNAR